MTHKVEGEEKKASLFCVYFMDVELFKQLCHKIRILLEFFKIENIFERIMCDWGKLLQLDA